MKKAAEFLKIDRSEIEDVITTGKQLEEELKIFQAGFLASLQKEFGQPFTIENKAGGGQVAIVDGKEVGTIDFSFYPEADILHNNLHCVLSFTPYPPAGKYTNYRQTLEAIGEQNL